MNEQLHTDCSILRNKMPAVMPISSNLSTKVRGPDFFKQIVQRYSIITRSSSFPSLILLRLLENAGGMTKLTNVDTNNIKKILNTGIRQYIDLYMTIQSRENSPFGRINSNYMFIKHILEQNVTVPESHFNNSLSPERHLPEQHVNIRTYPAKDTKNVVIPRLMRYLQRIDDQKHDYDFQPVSAKTLATTELLKTLSERVVSQRVRRENTAILSNNNYPESDIRVMRHTNLDKDDNFLYSGINKTQSSEIQIEKTVPFSELQHLKMPDIPLFDEYTNPMVADISGLGESENRKVRDVIVHPVTHAEENIPKPDTMMAHIQKRNQLVYEKHDNFHRRTADRYSVTEKSNIANRLISNTHIARSRVTNMEAEAGEVTGIPKEISLERSSYGTPKLLFDQAGVSLQQAGHAQTDMSGPSNLSSSNVVKKPSDLVLRKPAAHSAEKGFENTEKSDIIKTERTKIDAEKEDIIGTNIQARGSIDDIANTANIATIADRVYKLLETRISIEKERRGLR